MRQVGEEEKFVYIPTTISGLALLGSAYLGDYPVMALMAMALCVSAAESCVGPFWTFPTRMFHGAASATVVAIIGAIGNLGGFIGPSIIGILVGQSGNFFMGIVIMSAFIMGSGVFVAMMNEDKLKE